MELQGKVAIVTGASLGIGSACALDLAKNGADVAINYRKHDTEANAICDQIRALGRRGLAVRADRHHAEPAPPEPPEALAAKKFAHRFASLKKARKWRHAEHDVVAQEREQPREIPLLPAPHEFSHDGGRRLSRHRARRSGGRPGRAKTGA